MFFSQYFLRQRLRLHGERVGEKEAEQFSVRTQMGTCTLHSDKLNAFSELDLRCGQQFHRHLSSHEHASCGTHPPDQPLVAYWGPLVTHSFRKCLLSITYVPGLV